MTKDLRRSTTASRLGVTDGSDPEWGMTRDELATGLMEVARSQEKEDWTDRRIRWGQRFDWSNWFPGDPDPACPKCGKAEKVEWNPISWFWMCQACKIIW